jgi:hypothetical protein
MKVEVVNHLAGVVSLVDAKAVPALRDAFARRHLRGGLEHGADHPVSIGRQAIKMSEVLVRDHQ